MTTAHRRPSARSLASTLVVAVSVTALVACSDDPETSEGTADTTVEEVAMVDDESANAAFCEGFIGLEMAFAEAPEDEAEIPPFVEERIAPNLALIEGNEPATIAEDVRTMTSAVEEVTSTGDFSALETLDVLGAAEAVYTSLGDACDVNVVEFSAVDYDYEGIPETLPAGVTSFVMSNDSTAGEAHEISLVKLSDDIELSVEELLEMPEAQADQHVDTFAGGTFAPADASSGMVVELTPGRWAYVCFVPVGTIHDTEGSGPPHFVEGMAGEFTVQ